MFNKKNKLGAVALPAILILGSIIVDIVVMITLSVNFLINSNYGIRLSYEALAAARAGVQDGIMRLSRDKTFIGTYQLTVGKRAVDVTVCKDVPCTEMGKYKVSAVGYGFTRRRKIEAVLFVTDLGVLRLKSMKEVPL